MKPYDWRTHEWKVGDRVLVRPYVGDPYSGRVVSIVYAGHLLIEENGNTEERFTHHRAECEPLEPIVEKKPRGWWINEAMIKSKTDSDSFPRLDWQTWFERGNAPYIRTTPPEDCSGWIYVEETEFKE
jgi:hypothetical protein